MKIAKNYRLDEKLIEQIKIVSEHQNRSATNLIETVLKEYCANQIQCIKRIKSLHKNKLRGKFGSVGKV